MTGSSDSFFVSGGTVPLESPSYVEREADRALLEALSAGKFCYVLNSRQMGKSSLCVRTMSRLAASGTRCAFVDLTKIGGRNVTPDQWYAGLTVEVGRPLGLRLEMLKSWQEEQSLGPMQRFFSALRDVALDRSDAPIVIFVDEIDATRSLPFSANEFFAGIRECYNRRVHDPAYKRLTFCLLGVAVPGDLMADVTTTPFNIGERVVLTDFSETEAAKLAAGLGLEGREAQARQRAAEGKEILHRILHWTSGHPFLTQSLASTISTRSDIHTAADVDRLVAELLFQAKARETNINLADVGNRVLNGYSDPEQINKYRADILSLYEKVLRGGEVFDDESNRLVTVLKLAGIVRVEDRKLKIRNRIYERVFDRTWVRENMPGAEIRRQRRAFIKGALRTAAVAAVVIAIIGFLAWNNARLAEQARQERDRANYEVYVASMNLMRPLWEQQNLERVQDLLTSTKDNPARGWEWAYWNRMVHPEIATYPRRTSLNYLPAYSATGKAYLRDDGKIVEYSPDTGQLVDLMPMMGQSGGYLVPIRDGKGLMEWSAENAQVIDLQSRTRSAKLEDVGSPGITTHFVSADGQWVVGGRASEWSSATTSYRSGVIWNTETGEAKALPTNPIRSIIVSPDARLIAAAEVDTRAAGEPVRVVVREFGSWKALYSFETLGPATVLSFSPHGTRLATGSSSGWVQLWDLSTRREISRTQANGRPVYSIEFSLDESWLAAGGLDRIGRLYDVSGSQFKLLQAFPDAMQVVIQSDRSRVATAYFSSYLSFRIYDPKTYIQTPTALSGFDRVDSVDVLGKKVSARARSGDKAFDLDPITGKSTEIDGLSGKPLLLPESGETWGLTRREDGTIEITDFDLRRTVFTLPKSDRIPIEVAQFADNRRAALSYTDKRLEIWDTVAGTLIKQVPCPQGVVFVKVSPDGRWLAVSALNGALSVWDTTTWTERPLSPASGAVAVTFSSDGARLLAATANDNAEVWDTRTWKLLGKLIGHALTVEDVSYSPDGKRIVTASDDGTIRLWDPETFRELTTLTGHNQTVFRARFTDDGSSIISIDDKGTAKMWLTKTPAGLITPAMSAQAR